MTQTSSSALPAFVRGMRTLLMVQLLVAVIAVGATVWAALKLPDLAQQVAELNAQIDAKEAEITRLADQQTSLNTQLEQTTRASRLLAQGLEIGARGNWDEAVTLIAQAQATDPNKPFFLRELAEAEYRARRFDDAIRHIGEARALSADDPAYDDFTREATYQCAAGRANQAEQALRDPVFLAAARANPALVMENTALMQACPQGSHAYFRQLVGNLESGGPAADPSAFRIRTVYLHVARREDRENARRLRESLRQAGYSVPPIVEVIGAARYSPNVRYYYGAQAEQAGQIAQIVQEAAAANGVAPWSANRLRTISLEGDYQGLPTSTAEVWLPPSQ